MKPTPAQIAGDLDAIITFSISNDRAADLLKRFTFRIDEAKLLPADDPRRECFADDQRRPNVTVSSVTKTTFEELPLAPRCPPDKRPVACFRLYGLYTPPALRGLGLANVMLELAHRQCATSAAMDGHSVVAIFIEPDPFTHDDEEKHPIELPDLRDWYRRRGYRGFPGHPVSMWRCHELRPKGKP